MVGPWQLLAGYLSRNGSNAFGDQTGGGYSSATGGGLAATNQGADIKVWGLGLMHNF